MECHKTMEECLSCQLPKCIYDDEPKKSSWGGKREGAGRKRKEKIMTKFLKVKAEGEDSVTFLNLDNIVWVNFDMLTIKTVDGGIWPMDHEAMAILMNIIGR